MPWFLNPIFLIPKKETFRIIHHLSKCAAASLPEWYAPNYMCTKEQYPVRFPKILETLQEIAMLRVGLLTVVGVELFLSAWDLTAAYH